MVAQHPGKTGVFFSMWIRVTQLTPYGKISKKEFQENYNTPLEHNPGNPLGQLWKDSVGKGLGVCSKGVVKQP